MSTNIENILSAGIHPSGRVVDTEHRGVSVLFADLVGSTEYVEELGAEGFRDLIGRFHAICNEIVRSRSGVVAQYQGDGIICYFGFPRAAENDAAHAVAAGLDICEALSALKGDIRMATRIGIASGSVMLKADGDDFGSNAVGSCINKAARLEALADVGNVLICNDTHDLIGDLFRVRGMGEYELKGFRGKQLVHKVERRRKGIMTRFEALRGRKVSPLIGRQTEMHKLNGHFAAAQSGSRRAVIVSADAGLGKSRLVDAFLHQPQLENVPRFVLQCAPEHRGTALYPVLQYLEWVAGIGRNDPNTSRHEKLKRLFLKVWQSDDAELDILLQLLSPLGAETAIDETESVPLRRGRALTLLADKIYAAVAGRRAMIVVFEDVHWIDPTSALLLEILIGKASEQSALVLALTRPESPFDDDYDLADELIRLGPLPDEQAKALARQSPGKTDLTEDQIDAVIVKSEGNPLFLEKYAEMLSNAVSNMEWQIPLTLSGLAQSKLDRLDRPARELARVGSALGRSFQPILAAQVAGLDPDDVPRLVEALVVEKLAEISDLVEGEDALTFSHALIRDAVYGSMSSDMRVDLHCGIADLFIAQGARQSVEDNVLAAHLANAGRHDEAVERYMQAALAAAGQGAAFEALAILEAGLECVAKLPEGAGRDKLELQLCAIKGPTQMVTRGPGNPSFGDTQKRAMDLVSKLGLHETMVPVIYNSALHAWATAQLDKAMCMANAISMINDEMPTDAAFMAANTMRGLIAWHQGHNDLALQALGRTVGRHDPDIHKGLYAVFLKEFGVFSLFYLGLAHTVRGDFDHGRDYADKAAVLGQKMGFPHARGFGLLAQFNTAMMRNDLETAYETSMSSLDFATRQGFPEMQAMSQFVQGWVKARRGDLDGGVSEMQGGLSFWAATGFTCWQGHFASYLARDLVQLGRLEHAEGLIGKSLDMLSVSGENQSLSPLLLAQAEVLQARGDATAQTIAQHAWQIASDQGAKLWQGMVAERFAVDTQ